MSTSTKDTPICNAMRAAGQWNDNWEPMAELDPQWTEQFMAMVSRPLNSGVLDARTFELIAIAVDASVTHMYAPGVRRHIRRALDIGVPAEEIAAVLQLTSSLGLHTMSLAAPILVEEMRARTSPASAT
ncbi:MAG: carboxymuconolactone decarboxylase family protein [Hydrogenophaga sp.]|nr:carboxymuconolactone decarboxylase family protein [Hydrogenophaga sp.]